LIPYYFTGYLEAQQEVKSSTLLIIDDFPELAFPIKTTSLGF
jgi:hypothetical protein